MTSDVLRIAIIGAGSIGRDRIALIQASAMIRLAGICDPADHAVAIAVAAKTSLYHDIESLIQTETPDGIIIASPNGLHAEHARACAAHNIPMLIEKPIAGTLQDARQIELLDATILVGHFRRFNPLVAECRSMLDEGAIGKPIGVSAMWSLRKPPEYFEVEWRVQRPNGGPALINLIHDIDDLRFMLGEIESVFARSSHAARNLEVEDTLSISLKFESGVLGTILISDSAPSPWAYEATIRERDFYGHSNQNCYHFVGTEGALAFPQLELWRHPQLAAPDWRQTLECTTRDVHRQNPMHLQLEHFLSIIKGEAQPLITASDATRSLATVLGILQSAEQQGPISLDSVLAGS